MKKVAINGFGRIGRMVFRNLVAADDFSVVAINSKYSPEQIGHLIQYDTIHGYFPCDIEYQENSFLLNGQTVHIVNDRNPENLPWSQLNIDYVVESTGAFRTKETCEGHLRAGAKKVVLTAPAKDDMKMIVMGVNDSAYKQESIISNASCTTNCLAPVIKVLDDHFTIKNGLMTTIHSYTNDQTILDNPHKDLRRARANGLNMIPTSTGAAKAIGKILPHLNGKLNGLSVRVPTPNVSLVDLVIDIEEKTDIQTLNALFQAAKSKEMSGILDYNELPLVSSDYNTNAHSTIVDGLSTMVMEDSKIKILAWYDNEWGYSNRVIDILRLFNTDTI